MDPVSLIVAALAAGAVAGTQKTATEAVTDAYRGLKTLVRKRLAGRRVGEVAAEEHETQPERWAPILEGELAEVGARDDAALLAAAQRLSDLLEATGNSRPEITAHVTHSQGVQSGNDLVQNNYFSGATPSAAPAGRDPADG